MESGKKAVVIIIIAMMLTAGVGFLFNFDTKEDNRRHYSVIGNIDALVSANSDRTEESEVYNAVQNVNGWTGERTYEYTDLPNPYIYRPTQIYENTDDKYGVDKSPTSSTYNISTNPYTSPHNKYSYDYGRLISQGNYNDNYTRLTSEYYYKFTNDTQYTITHTSDGSWSEVTSFSAKQTMDDNSGFRGGYSQRIEMSYWLPSGSEWYGNTKIMDVNLALNKSVKTSYDSGNFFGWCSLEDVFSSRQFDQKYTYRIETIPQIYEKPSLSIQGISPVTFGPNSSANGTTTMLSLDATPIDLTDVVYLQYVRSTHSWRAIDSDNNIAWTKLATDIYLVSDSPNITVPLKIYHTLGAQYIDPTKYVKLSGEAIWSVPDNTPSDGTNKVITAIPTQVSFLVKGSGTIYISGEESTPYNYLGPIRVTESDNFYIVNGTVIGRYIGVKITISSITDEINVQGIVSDNSGEGTSDTPAYDYVMSDVIYPVDKKYTYVESGVTYTVSDYTIPHIYRLKFSPLSTSMSAYISETWILSDPNQILWKDIDINIADYFNENKSKLRVLLQGFVRYGTAISINQHSFDVIDGKITYTDSEAKTSKSFELNGMAIDYFEGHVYITQTNGSAQQDLGAITSYALVMDGVWYFSTSVSEISIEKYQERIWTTNWMMDTSTTILVFVGIIFASLVIMGMRYRDEMELLDVIILILAMLIAMSLLVIT